MTLYRLFIALFILFNITNHMPAQDVQPDRSAKKATSYIPEKGSVENKKTGKPQKPEIDPKLPYVLIIGDSISMGYTQHVRNTLTGKANIIHSKGNSQGTTLGLQEIDSWIGDTQWDIIHFNWGLHDLKRVKVAGTSQNSKDSNDPQQADLAQYSKNLAILIAKLKATKAELIFATTTPFPSGVKPYREPLDAERYNTAALKAIRGNDIIVNDLYTLVYSKLDELQKPINVHFHPAGSELMAQQVAELILAILEK